jgi:hypothetical protein
MISEINYTLITDGSSDRTLMQIINWSLNDLFSQLPFKGVYADFASIHQKPKSLKEKIRIANQYYPFNLLFIHRDAESTNLNFIERRIEEIQSQIDDEMNKIIICVIPVKMMETWLLIDEYAIKRAAGNRNYGNEIILPGINSLENTQNPKDILHNILYNIAGKKRKLNTHKAVHLVAEYITDFSPLRNLVAFKKFEQDLKMKVKNLTSL